MFTVVMNTIVRMWKYPVKDDWIKQLCCVNKMEYYAAIKTKFCKLLQFEWKLRTCEVKEEDEDKWNNLTV